MKPFTVVEDILRRVVAANPDNKPEASYFDKTTREPVCGIGNVLAELGARGVKNDDSYDDSYVFLFAHQRGVVNAAGEFIIEEGICVNDIPSTSWELLDIEPPTREQATWIRTFQAGQDGSVGVFVGDKNNKLTWSAALQAADTERARARARAQA